MGKRMTSAGANKLLKSWNDRIDYLYRTEAQTYQYTEVEGVAPVIPEYDFASVRMEITLLNDKVVMLKHALNMFNMNTWIEPLNMTVDKALVKMKQLSRLKDRLNDMRNMQPKALKPQLGVRSTNQVEYTVANFSISEAEESYDRISEELTRLQLELDIVNNTIQFEFDEETGEATFGGWRQ